jgi:hypothetical protein
MSKIVLRAADLDGYLSEKDKGSIESMMNKYDEAVNS